MTSTHSHVITIDYPALDLLDTEHEELALPEIENSSNRFEPRALIDDAAIQRQASRDNLNETGWFVVQPAKLCRKDDNPIQISGNFFLEMSQIARYGGKSIVQILTYQKWDTSQTQQLDHIRIRRVSRLRDGSDEFWRHSGTYDMTTEEFDNFEPQYELFQQIFDLLHGRSDRAVAHIRARLRYQGSLEEPIQWKPRRFPRYEQVIGAAASCTSLLSLEADDRACALCTCDFHESDQEAMTLNCSSKHKMCRRCLIQCCQTEGPGVRCPWCRQQLFVDVKIVEWLKYGVHDKAYIPDSRYDDWENFERSCADLDMVHAENDPRVIKLDRAVLRQAWTMLIRGARMELPESTPWALQPVRFPQQRSVSEGFEHLLATIGQLKGPVQVMYKVIMGHLLLIASRAYHQPSVRGVTEIEEWASEAASQTPIESELRPGHAEFIRRMVSRSLQYAMLRRCQCSGSAHHRHGLREYFDVG